MEAVIFCGIQASGKSTYYKENFFRTHVRISLDQLNTRNKEDKFIETCLLLQQRFVVDNTNPTKADRAKYILKAKAHKFKIVGYYFKSSMEASMSRNATRIGKENIPEVGIKATLKRLEIPSFDEAFDELYSVEILDGKFETTKLENEI